MLRSFPVFPFPLSFTSSNHHLLQRCQDPCFSAKKPSSLPLIHRSLSSSSSQTLLYSHVDLLLGHFLSYYDTLDNTATQENILELFFRSWCNSLEIPLSWRGVI